MPLTEAERELVLDTPPARGPNSPLWSVYSGLTAKLEPARPEHPKRLEALEELVGRRVRVPHLGLSGCISAKLNPQWQVDFDGGGMDTFFRDDFELLEDA